MGGHPNSVVLSQCHSCPIEHLKYADIATHRDPTSVICADMSLYIYYAACSVAASSLSLSTRTENLFAPNLRFHQILQSTTTTTPPAASPAHPNVRINIHLPFKSLFYPPLNRKLRRSRVCTRAHDLPRNSWALGRVLVRRSLAGSFSMWRHFESTPSCIKRQGHRAPPERTHAENPREHAWCFAAGF